MPETVACVRADSAVHKETLRVARAETAAGDDAAADRRIRSVLDATRAEQPPVWFLAVANLTALYMRQDREIESLRLARLLADNCADRKPLHRAYALQTLCMAFANLDDFERLGRVLPRFEDSIGACVDPDLSIYRRSVGLLRALVSMRQNELDEAARACERVIASFDETATNVTIGAAHLIAAQIAQRTGRFADGLASARLARANAPTLSATLPALLVETQCAFEIGGAASAIDVVRASLDDVESLARSSHEPSHVVQAGSRLAEFVTDCCGDEESARRLLDAAVAAVLRRAEQLGRSLDDLPELAAASPDDELSLATFRIKFRLGKQQLLTAVARVIRASEDGAPFLHSPSDGLVCVCAWCLRVRRGEGWLPVGHFLEGGYELRVTHGLCPDCAERL